MNGGIEMSKKLTLVLISVLLIASLLVGCGGSNVDGPGNTEPTPEPATAEPTDPEETEEPTESDIDISEFVELKMVMVGPELDDYERIIELVNAKLKEDVNASLTVEFLDWGEFATKYPLKFASGEEFDLCYTSNWSFYGDQAGKGGFLELTMEDIEKYMPRINENVTADMWDGVKVDGKIFMIPQTGLQFTGDHNNKFVIRGDLLEKYGMSEIKTADDLIEYWDNVVEHDPDMVPIAINQSWWGWWVISSFRPVKWVGENYGAGPFNVYEISDPDNIKIIDGDEWWADRLEGFKMAREFQQKGYWSKDALTLQDDNGVMFENGVSATAVRQITMSNEMYEKINATKPEWKPMIVDIHPDRPAPYYPVTGDGMALHATTKHKERSMMVLDLISYDQEYYDLIYYGVKDEDYTLNDDGSFTSIGAPVNVGFRGMNNKVARMSTTVAPNYKEILDNQVKNGFHPKFNNFIYNNKNIEAIAAAISSIEEKYAPILQMGFTDDVEGMTEQFRKEVEAAGLKEYQDDFTAQVIEFAKRYKD
jgi:putative aldouronate transport system substrate-binding protein